MRKNIFKQKTYKHIDKVVDIKDIESKIKNPNYIILHGFYPFLSQTLDYRKYTEEINDETKHHW